MGPRHRQGPPSLLLALGLGLCLALSPGAQAEDDAGDASDAVRAYTAWQQGDLEAALTWSAKAVERPGATAYAWMLRGYVLSRAGQKAEAVTAYQRSAELDPDDPRTQNNLGAVLLQMGRVGEAQQPLARAVELDVRYADAQNNLGAAHERAGRLDQARSAYRAATRVDPRHVHAYNNLGALAIRQGREAEARASLERARALAPAASVPGLNLLLLGGGDLAAGELFDRLQAAGRAPGASPRVRARALAALAGRAAKQRDFETARRFYLEALAFRPNDAMLLNNVAVAEDRLGLERDAILHLEAALENRPGLLVARNNIGIVHVHRGDLERAERVFRGILADDRRFHRAHYNLGVVLAARGDLRNAVRSLETASALAPNDVEVIYNLGLLRRRLGGSADEERRAYERALRLDPSLAEAHLALGCLLADPQTRADLRDEARAAHHLRRFQELALPSDDEGRAEALAWLDWLEDQ